MGGKKNSTVGARPSRTAPVTHHRAAAVQQQHSANKRPHTTAQQLYEAADQGLRRQSMHVLSDRVVTISESTARAIDMVDTVVWASYVDDT